MRYLIKPGQYTRYTITGFNGGGEMVYIDHAPGMKQVLDKFVHKLQPGDSIEWVDTEQAAVASVAAWWAEQDGAMPI